MASNENTTTTNKTCECGCGEAVTRHFRPGHDARRKSYLVHEATWGVTRGKKERAMTELLSRGWAHFLDDETLGSFVFRARDSKGRYVKQVHEGEFVWGDAEAFEDERGTVHSTTKCGDWNGRRTQLCESCVRTHDVFELAQEAQFKKAR